jgi:shikimate dehydrogenase
MTPSVPIAAVLGYPVTHSRSPRLHGHWLERHKIAGHYVPLQVAPEDLEAALALLPRLGFRGANVTLPHKEAALALADEATPTARRIGAANTLFFSDAGIRADNTDAYGFTRNVLDHQPDWRPRAAAVIGAGGAARAIIVALLDQGAKEIRLTNRTPDRAAHLAQEFGAAIRVHPWQARSDMLSGCDTLVNATALGMTGKPPLELSLDALPRDALVNDLVYAPIETALLAAARARGNSAADGLGMLLHQAVPGFEGWFGLRPSVDAALRDAVLAP